MTALFIKILLILVVALLFGLVVFVHELGHFLAARWLGFRVTAFAIGMGPALWKRKVGHTEYRLNAVPFGGYCVLPQLDPSGMEKLQGEHGAGEKPSGDPLPDIAPWRRIIVSLAGPAGNVVLALLAAWLIYAFAPAAATGALDTRIGHVDEASAAWDAGLREGQSVVRVGRRPVRTWYDFKIESHLAANAGERVALTLEDADGAELTAEVPLVEKNGLRVIEGLEPFDPCRITDMEVESPALRAGMKLGDRVLAVNGRTVWSGAKFSKAVAENGEAPLTLTVLRDGGELTLDVTPVFDPELKRARIGVAFQVSEWTPPWMRHRDPGAQVMWDAGSVYRALNGLVAQKAPGESRRVATSIGGPVALLGMLWMSVNAGVWICLGMVRLICVNLAIINLLPFPVLDGGHILFALWEIITRRKPHPKVVGALVNVFAVLLIGLMLLLVTKDLWGIGEKALRKKEPADTPQNQPETPDPSETP